MSLGNFKVVFLDITKRIQSVIDQTLSFINFVQIVMSFYQLNKIRSITDQYYISRKN